MWNLPNDTILVSRILRQLLGFFKNFKTPVSRCFTNEMGRACGTYGGEESWVHGFGGERDHLEDVGVDGRQMLK